MLCKCNTEMNLRMSDKNWDSELYHYLKCGRACKVSEYCSIQTDAEEVWYEPESLKS